MVDAVRADDGLPVVTAEVLAVEAELLVEAVMAGDRAAAGRVLAAVGRDDAVAAGVEARQWVELTRRRSSRWAR